MSIGFQWSGRIVGCLALACLLTGCAIGGRQPPTIYAPSEPMVEHRAGMTDEPVFGGRMYIFVAGPLEEVEEVETVVLVHGLSTQGASDWRHLVPLLARRHQVVAFDLPGFARSDKGEHLYSLEKYSELLHWLIGEWAEGPMTLVGHSFGGALALYHADQRPDDVDRLVVVDAAGILHRTAFVKYVASVKDAGILSASADVEEGLNHFIGWLLEAAEKIPGTDMAKVLADGELRSRYLRDDPGAVAGSAMMEVDFSQRLDTIEQPTLVIWGEDDDIAPLRTGRVLAGRLPDVRLQTIPDAGHAPMLRTPAAFNRMLLSALDNWPPADPIRLPDRASSTRVGICDGRDDVTFVGDYAELRIQACDRVRVRDGSLGKVEIESASVDFQNVRIDAADVGLHVDDSSVTLTNARIEAEIALLVDDARVDLASVELVGRGQAVKSLSESNLVFSVCHIQSPHGSGTLHGAWEFNEDEKL